MRVMVDTNVIISAILNTAIEYNVDILVTGDKHFIELDIEIPQICTPSEYRDLYIRK